MTRRGRRPVGWQPALADAGVDFSGLPTDRPVNFDNIEAFELRNAGRVPGLLPGAVGARPHPLRHAAGGRLGRHACGTRPTRHPFTSSPTSRPTGTCGGRAELHLPRSETDLPASRPVSASPGNKKFSRRIFPSPGSRKFPRRISRLQPGERHYQGGFYPKVQDGSSSLQPGERLSWEQEIFETDLSFCGSRKFPETDLPASSPPKVQEIFPPPGKRLSWNKKFSRRIFPSPGSRNSQAAAGSR